MKNKFKRLLTKKYVIAACALILLVIAFFAGQNYSGTNKADSGYGEYDRNAYYTEEATGTALSDDAAADGEAAENKSSSLFQSSDDENQKLIYSGYAYIGTKDMDKSYKDLSALMAKYNARFESFSETSNSKSMLIRVPKDNFLPMYESLSDISGNITSSDITITDETKKYADNKRRLGILESEYDELKDLMSKAKNVEEVLAIRDRMADVTYEIETLKGANDTIDYDADYAKLNLTISLTGMGAEPESFWQQITEAFEDGLYALKSVFLGLISIWWLITAIVIAIIVINKVRRKKHNKKDLQKTEDPDELQSN